MTTESPYKCPYCGGNNTWGKGKRLTKYEGIKMLRYCRDCHRKFTPKHQIAIEQK